jgi:hypothetical protein
VILSLRRAGCRAPAPRSVLLRRAIAARGAGLASTPPSAQIAEVDPRSLSTMRKEKNRSAIIKMD